MLNLHPSLMEPEQWGQKGAPADAAVRREGTVGADAATGKMSGDAIWRADVARKQQLGVLRLAQIVSSEARTVLPQPSEWFCFLESDVYFIPENLKRLLCCNKVKLCPWKEFQDSCE